MHRLLLVVATGVAVGSPCRAQGERLACASCHVANDGGPLTELGRQYRWRATGFDHAAVGIELSGTQVGGEGGGGGSSGNEPPAGGEADSNAAFGRWSGQAAIFGRRGRTRRLGSSSTLSSAIETVGVHGAGLFGDERISFDGEGYARNGHHTFDGSVDDDEAGLATAQLTWRDDATGTQARLGRQFIFAGAATRRIDGLDVRTGVGKSSDLELFGGVPSDRGFGGASGDLIAGGRLGTRLGESFAVGASGFYAKDASDPSDVKGGLDARWAPLRHVDLFGHVYYDWIADRIYDGRVRATWAPSVGWQLAADWNHSVPALFLPKNSIFWVFSVDAYEETALTVTRRFHEHLAANLFGRHTAYERGEHLEQLGGGLDARYGPNGEDTVGGEIAWQDAARSELGGSSIDGDVLYVRAYHQLWWTEAVYTALDASVQFMLEADGDDATLVRLATGYDTHKSWDVELGVDWRRDLDFDDTFDVFARIRLRF